MTSPASTGAAQTASCVIDAKFNGVSTSLVTYETTFNVCPNRSRMLMALKLFLKELRELKLICNSRCVLLREISIITINPAAGEGDWLISKVIRDNTVAHAQLLGLRCLSFLAEQKFARRITGNDVDYDEGEEDKSAERSESVGLDLETEGSDALKKTPDNARSRNL
jgi:hypothetical protein